MCMIIITAVVEFACLGCITTSSCWLCNGGILCGSLVLYAHQSNHAELLDEMLLINLFTSLHVQWVENFSDVLLVKWRRGSLLYAGLAARQLSPDWCVSGPLKRPLIGCKWWGVVPLLGNRDAFPENTEWFLPGMSACLRLVVKNHWCSMLKLDNTPLSAGIFVAF